jgi:glutamate N-acetyltransferase/amino-acid N-acetyltransferase
MIAERSVETGCVSPAGPRRLLRPGIAHLTDAQLYTSSASPDGVFRPPIDYPPHEGTVEITIDLGAGRDASVVLGSDLSHEYVSENADYRS